MDAQAFYDDLAPDYDVLHADWPASVRAQGEVLDALVRGELGDAPHRVLDCSCGIGTQAIGLALRGHDVLATDLSPASVARARSEAAAMGAQLATGVADFTRLAEQVEGTFDCVLSCDNAVAHLHGDDDLARFAEGVAAKLRPGGLALVSLRDYAALLAERVSGHPVRVGPGTISFQVWEWDDDGRALRARAIHAARRGRALADGLPPHAPARAAARRPLRCAPRGRARRTCAGARRTRPATTSRS